jgi:hypothetical protein
MRTLSLTLLHWAARATGGLLVVMVIIFAVGHGSFPPLVHANWPQLMQHWSLLAILGGFIIGWRYPLCGGLLALLGLVMFNCVNFARAGELPTGAFPLFVIPVLLLLLSGTLQFVHRRAA